MIFIELEIRYGMESIEKNLSNCRGIKRIYDENGEHRAYKFVHLSSSNLDLNPKCNIL